MTKRKRGAPHLFSAKGIAETRQRYAAYVRKHGFGPDQNTVRERLDRYYAALARSHESGIAE